ncbi:MAG: hypothetical protein LPH21_07415 [Shewanella sp.]|nr:hypothetical protein [Shewanella sp.]
MGRRRRGELDELLEGWARWVDAGGVIAPGGSSMLGRLIDNQGMMFFGSGGGSDPLVDCIEAKIESCVLQMALAQPQRADVLRLEYGAGWHSVTARQGVRGYNPQTADQFDNARVLACSLRTYRRRLAAAREDLQQRLGLL